LQKLRSNLPIAIGMSYLANNKFYLPILFAGANIMSLLQISNKVF
jgi:hypothetical protein